MKTKLLAFQKAYNELNIEWNKDNKDLSEKYPFEKSFDELTVNNWVNHQIRSIKDEN